MTLDRCDTFKLHPIYQSYHKIFDVQYSYLEFEYHWLVHSQSTKLDTSKRACVSLVHVSDMDTLTERFQNVFVACPVFGHVCSRTVSACPENMTLFSLKKCP